MLIHKKDGWISIETITNRLLQSSHMGNSIRRARRGKNVKVFLNIRYDICCMTIASCRFLPAFLTRVGLREHVNPGSASGSM